MCFLNADWGTLVINTANLLYWFVRLYCNIWNVGIDHQCEQVQNEVGRPAKWLSRYWFLFTNSKQISLPLSLSNLHCNFDQSVINKENKLIHVYLAFSRLTSCIIIKQSSYSVSCNHKAKCYSSSLFNSFLNCK